MKYINADKIRNAIESEADNWGDTYTDCMRDNLLTILDYLQQEQPKVDLEKEIIDYWIATKWCQIMTLSKFKVIARYFYGLGLNARK